ncbi:MAG: SpoVA/SpoVAEb family sporulation membrane protein [Ruminococcaceae bacterium]|nr:SpoVA/SpoVAEb family sporulation membrane protein [Oscillospiraceae bacterium]
MNKDNFKYYATHHADKSPILKDAICAFIFGGGICFFAELLLTLYMKFGFSEETSRLTVTLTLIFLTCLLTGIGVFDRIAKIGGAGTFVPITGFANAMVSPAIDYTAEGYVTGLGSKMFIIAGPVIVYGTVSSIIYGIIYWFLLLL